MKNLKRLKNTMNSIDLNSIGRSLYKEINTNYGDPNYFGRRLPLNVENSIKKDIIGTLKGSNFYKENLIEDLKNILLLCYLSNIDINDFITLNIHEENN